MKFIANYQMFNMKLLIAVSGKLGSGKDYITSEIIVPVIKRLRMSFLQLNFADQIKVNVMTKN